MNLSKIYVLTLAFGIVWNNQAWAQGSTTDADSILPFGPAVNDEAVWFHVMFEQFEGRFGGEDTLCWEGETWAGTDTNRLWLKSEGQLTHGNVEDGQQEIFYDRPISPYFDLQAGLRYDLDSKAGLGWAAFGIEGLAPYFLHISATGYASDMGHYAAKSESSYDLFLTQRLILQTEAEINAYSKSDTEQGVSSGFSDIDAGLRLRYEISRKFAPYFGVTYERKLEQVEHYGSVNEERFETVRVAIGIRFWF